MNSKKSKSMSHNSSFSENAMLEILSNSEKKSSEDEEAKEQKK